MGSYPSHNSKNLNRSGLKSIPCAVTICVFVRRLAGALLRCPALVWNGQTARRPPCIASRQTCPKTQIVTAQGIVTRDCNDAVLIRRISRHLKPYLPWLFIDAFLSDPRRFYLNSANISGGETSGDPGLLCDRLRYDYFFFP